MHNLTAHHPQSASSGDEMPELHPLVSALLRLSLRTQRRAEEETNHIARMEVYLEDLRAHRLEAALWALEEHPNRSKWWPAWQEIVELLGEWSRNHAPLALPRPAAPEHKPFQSDAAQQPPFASRLQWDQFQEALRTVSDPNVTLVAREPLLRIGETIERRQRPHAERMGWC